jgi:hypothetical protein
MTMLGRILAVLNVLAAAAFAFLFLMDHGKRQAWSYAVFRHDLAYQGLPLKEDRANLGLPPETILPQHLEPETLKAIFTPVGGEPVENQQEEVLRVQKKLLNDIDNAANEVLASAKDDKSKRLLVQKLLMPLAHSPFQIDGVAKKLLDPKMKGVALNNLVAEAARRRMLADLLVPLEEARPNDSKDPVLKRLSEVGPITAEQVNDVLTKRFTTTIAEKDAYGRDRDPLEKRRAIALLLVGVGQLRKTDGELLYPKGAERAQVVAGLREYNVAVDALTQAVKKVEDRVVAAVELDRTGSQLPTEAGTIRWNDGFIGQLEKRVLELQGNLVDIQNREKRLNELRAEKKKHEDQFQDRKKHYDDVLARLISERAKTAALTAEARRLEEQLFLSQVEVADAFEANRRLLQEIRRLETQLKGAKAP